MRVTGDQFPNNPEVWSSTQAQQAAFSKLVVHRKWDCSRTVKGAASQKNISDACHDSERSRSGVHLYGVDQVRTNYGRFAITIFYTTATRTRSYL